jgi:signal transduction histidine kinase
VEPIKLLLIEDNPDDIFIIKRLLNKRPEFALQSADQLAAGLELLTRSKVELVLLDLNLPDSHGLATLSQVKDHTPTIPIVVLTGFNDENTGFEAVQNGAQDYLVKGEVDSNLLVRAIRYAIQRKYIEEELRDHRARLEELVAERTAELRQINEQLQQEIIERKRAEKQALELAIERERARVLADFIRDTSHDFRTPLSTINTSLYLLKKIKDNPAQRQWHIEVIERQAARLEKLIDGLMTMSRLDSSMAFTFRSIDLIALINDIVTQFDPEIDEKHLAFDLVVPDEMLPVQADESEISRAVTELVQNAIQFTPAGGHVIVSLEAKEKDIIIDVCDNGIGIEEHDLPRIFDTLYRVDKSRSTDTGGIGLGLAIARKIIEKHGGHIEVSSTPGQGSTFQIVLPQWQPS